MQYVTVEIFFACKYIKFSLITLDSDLPTVLTSSEPEKTSSLLSKQRLLEDKKVSQSRGSHCDVIQSNFSMKKSYTTLLKKKKVTVFMNHIAINCLVIIAIIILFTFSVSVCNTFYDSCSCTCNRDRGCTCCYCKKPVWTK